MGSVNNNNRASLPYRYDGIKEGAKAKHDDILTKKLVKIDGEMTAVFTRVNNKTLWQKIKNQLFSSAVSKQDAIAYSSIEIPAKAFEETLNMLKKNE